MIIDIPDEMIRTVKDGNWCGNHTIGETIRNGTPLKEWLLSFNTESATECFTAVQRLKERMNE